MLFNVRLLLNLDKYYLMGNCVTQNKNNAHRAHSDKTNERSPNKAYLDTKPNPERSPPRHLLHDDEKIILKKKSRSGIKGS